MPTNRREFIKQSIGLVSVSLLAPAVLTRRVMAQSSEASARRILVVVQLHGGNDGLNTLIPYTDSQYLSRRPNLALRESDLRDALGRSTVISNRFGFHPSLARLKELYDANKVAVVLGVGYPSPDLSHFTSIDIWHTASRLGSMRTGWLGRYADLSLGDKPLAAASFTNSSSNVSLPRTMVGERVIIPHIRSLENYGLQTDPKYPGNRGNRLRALLAVNNGGFAEGSLAARVASTSLRAVQGVLPMTEVAGSYRSAVAYPASNPLADALKMVAQLITALPDVNLLYVQLAGFDHHSRQVDSPKERLRGEHARLLQYFSEAVSAFYEDMQEHNLANNVVLMQWSEFGRRVDENGSLGTDHGAAGLMLIIGDPVRGGLYGEHPSLAPTNLDASGNMKYKVDFRSVYATILDRWLRADSSVILGGRFDDLGFLE